MKGRISEYATHNARMLGNSIQRHHGWMNWNSISDCERYIYIYIYVYIYIYAYIYSINLSSESMAIPCDITLSTAGMIFSLILRKNSDSSFCPKK